MMEWVRTWLLGVVCAGILVTVAQALTPNGAGKLPVRLAGGLVLLLAMVRPLIGMDYADLDWGLDWEEAIPAQVELGTAVTREQMKTSIAQATAAYILDKAEELDVPVAQAAVTCGETEEGVCRPVAVTLTGTWNYERQEKMARLIERDLDIPRPQQHYEEVAR